MMYIRNKTKGPHVEKVLCSTTAGKASDSVVVGCKKKWVLIGDTVYDSLTRAAVLLQMYFYGRGLFCVRYEEWCVAFCILWDWTIRSRSTVNNEKFETPLKCSTGIVHEICTVSSAPSEIYSTVTLLYRNQSLFLTYPQSGGQFHSMLRIVQSLKRRQRKQRERESGMDGGRESQSGEGRFEKRWRTRGERGGKEKYEGSFWRERERNRGG